MYNKTDKRIEAYFRTHQEDILKDLARLVEIPSVVSSPRPDMPYGEAAFTALMTAVEIAERMGFHTTVSGNCCMTADFGDRPNRLSLLAHLDVVEAGSAWTRPPFELSREQEWLYGRGVADNKGPCIALLYAMSAAREIFTDLPSSPQVWLGTAEEVGSPDLRAYIETTTFPPYVSTPDALEYVVIGESAKFRPEFYAEWTPSSSSPQVISLQGGKVRNAIPGYATAAISGLSAQDVEKAACEITQRTKVDFSLIDTDAGLEIRAAGKDAHIGHPERGLNAQTALIALLTSLPLAQCSGTSALHALARLFPCDDPSGSALGLTLHDDIFGGAQVNFTVCQMNNMGIRCKMDARGPLVSNPGNFSHIIDQALRMENFIVLASSMDPAHYVPERSEIVQKMMALYETYFGQPVKCSVSSGASYAHYIPGAISTGVAAQGIDTMLHSADERVLIEDILRVGMIYTQAILEFCAQEA